MKKKNELEAILSQLKGRPLISINGLEEVAGVPRGALNKAINGDDTFLSKKHLPKLKEVLKIYGVK